MDKVHTDFPVMGDAGIPASVVNISGNRSPYTTMQPRQGSESGDLPSATGNRAQSMVGSETLGPLCAPQTTLYYPNAATHECTGRNVKILPSRAGVSDFWDQRQ